MRMMVLAFSNAKKGQKTLTLPPFAYRYATCHHCLKLLAEMYHKVHKVRFDFVRMEN